jgi:hypothetical protein
MLIAMLRPKLGEVLLQAGLIDEDQLNFAVQAQEKTGASLRRILIDHHIVTEEQVIAALASISGIPRLDLENVQIDHSATGVLHGLSASWCAERGVVPLHYDRVHRTVSIAITDPSDVASLDELGFRTSAKVVPLLASEHEVEHIVRHLYYNSPLNRHLHVGSTPMNPLRNMAELMDNPEILHNMNEVRDHLQGTFSSAPPPDGGISVSYSTNDPIPSREEELENQQWSEHLEPLLEAQQAAARELQILFELCVAKGLIKRQEYLERLATLPD